MADEPNPPFYVLLAHSSLSNLPSGALSNTLGHPVIQYHYADDSPLSLLPNQPEEHVLVLNYDPRSTRPTVQSISEHVVVTGLKQEEAPVAAADETGTRRNDTMFIIETTSNENIMTASHGSRKSAQSTVAQFKHRNGIIRRALEYPTSSGDNAGATD